MGTSVLDGEQAQWAFGDQVGMAVGPSLFHLRSVLSSQGSTTSEHPWVGGVAKRILEAGWGAGQLEITSFGISRPSRLGSRAVRENKLWYQQTWVPVWALRVLAV